MSGTVWEKVLTEYPTFIKDLNLALRSNPSAATNATQLEALAGSVIGAGTIEGDPFALWVRKQYILDTRLTVGTKLHSLITPITNGLSGTDFGVFNIEATLFSTDAAGNETLLSGTSYPIFWNTDYLRINPSTQDEQMDIAASYGSVSPNFTANDQANTPYRVALDLPVQDRVIRQYLPAGSIATPTLPNVSDFYGTVVGFPVPAGTSLIVRVQNGSETFDAPVNNYAFGLKVGTSNFLGSRSLNVQLIRKEVGGSETVLLTRIVDKGPGALGIQLGNDPVVTTSLTLGLSPGVQFIGFTGDPLNSSLESILGLTPSTLLAARYNPARTTYDLYPNTGNILGGQGYFVRVPTGSQPTWKAHVESSTAVSVALRPGWNMITCPLGVSTPFANVQVIHTTEFPRTYLGASGNDAGDTSSPILGKDVFLFNPGANDSASGVPEGGTFVPGASFEPGAGYFVRCLAPEGAVMLFSPPAGQSFIRQSKASTPSQFLVQIQVARMGTSESSYVQLGQEVGATNGFDARFDSSLPPSFGGLQASVQNSESRFTDVRAYANSVTYRVNATGCVPGKKYAFNVFTKSGKANQYVIKNLQSGATYVFATATGAFGFAATSPNMSFDVTVNGAR